MNADDTMREGIHRPPRIEVAETEPLPAEEIRAFIERIEAADAAIADEREVRKETLAEARGRGYDSSVLLQIVRLRKADKDALAEKEAILDLYKQALGM